MEIKQEQIRAKLKFCAEVLDHYDGLQVALKRNKKLTKHDREGLLQVVGLRSYQVWSQIRRLRTSLLALRQAN